MFDFPPDSEGSETLTSSQSSMSCESCSSFNNFSFDTLETQTIKTPYSSSSPEYYSSLKPHRSSDVAWEVIRSAIFRNKNALNFKDFKLVRRIGSGDIGHVYLCRLKGINNNEEDDEKSNYYAMKVVDKEALAVKKKLTRAVTEKRILKMLDHPFLPTLYAEFEASHFSCVVMEYCSGGDLHSLRHKQPGKRFSLTSARFYAAEVLVALEYLHMLGIIYRDLKPENILVRSDGHIMLSDFDLSLCSNAIPVVESPDSSPFNTNSSSSSSSSTAISLYQKPSTAKSPSLFCFGGNRSFRSKKVRTITPNRQFVAEPVSARSCSFVGTHEYVSPEVASGKSHGNAVDWWAYGIFIYELIYGFTPFAGDTNEMTLRNIVKKKLSFPTESPASMSELHARELISELLVKDPEKRLGVKRGSAEVKTHAFFKGLNFALVRSYPPPGIPSLETAARFSTSSCQDANVKKNQSMGFDFF